AIAAGIAGVVRIADGIVRIARQRRAGSRFGQVLIHLAVSTGVDLAFQGLQQLGAHLAGVEEEVPFRRSLCQVLAAASARLLLGAGVIVSLFTLPPLVVATLLGIARGAGQL